MSVYVDPLINYGKAGLQGMAGRYFNNRPSCHLTADTLEELHEFAKRIGLQRNWVQDVLRYPHYDLTANKRAQAVRAGAVELSLQQAAERIEAARGGYHGKVP